MFIRRKANKSGTYSVQVVSKHGGRYRLEQSFGASSDEFELHQFEQKASDWIAHYGGQNVIDFSETESSVIARLCEPNEQACDDWISKVKMQ